MADIRRTSEYRKLLPFIAVASSDVGSDTIGEDVSALLLALETHKTGSDHDGRYYTETEVDSALILKADKTVTLVAGNGLSGGGDLSANRTFDVSAGLGIDFDVNGAVIVDLAENFTWLGNHSFGTTTYAKAIMPHVSDLYDLGDSAHLWRKIFASELSAVVFAKYEQVLLGGWFTVSKGEGILPADVTSLNGTINLGPDFVFTANDIIVFRGISNGLPQVEYVKVLSLVSDTTYLVTRDLDGSGANDWNAGTVYAIYGQVGNGRIELNAYDSPRLSVFSHADTIAGFREQVRIGDLINDWGYSASTYGGAFGSYESGKANITIDPTNGIRIRNYDQTVIQLTGTEASFENVIKLGTYARLEQGTGVWGTDFTGSAIWAEGSPATMMMGGWNNNVKQWWGGSDGKLYAGGGDVILDQDGITINTPQYSADPSNTIKFNYQNQEFYSIVGYNAGNQVTHLFESNSGNPMIMYDWITNYGQSSITYDQFLYRQDVFDNQWVARNKFQLDGINDTSFTYYINGLYSSNWNYKAGISGDINSLNGISELLIETTNYNATYTDKQARILIQADVKTPSSKIDLTADSINVIGNADISGNLVVDGNLNINSGAVKHNNLYQPEYTVLHNSSSTGTTWQRVALLEFNTGTYLGANFELEFNYGSGNWGQVIPRTYKFSIRCTRSGSTQDVPNDAEVVGNHSDYCRVVKTTTGVYEIQVRAIDNWIFSVIKIRPIATSRTGLTITYGLATGSTTGTIYSSNWKRAERVVLLNSPISLYTNKAFTVNTTTTYDVQDFGISSSAKMIYIRTYTVWGTARSSYYLTFEKYGTSDVWLLVRAMVAEIGSDVAGWIGLDDVGRFNVKCYGASTQAYGGAAIYAYME